MLFYTLFMGTVLYIYLVISKLKYESNEISTSNMKNLILYTHITLKESYSSIIRYNFYTLEITLIIH